MPLYEYQCEACAHRFEVIQKYSDPPVDICPNCGGAVRKLLSSPAIQFKGSGFYITDYARAGKSGGDSASSSASSGEKSESKSETKSESTSEAKAEKPKSESTAESKADSKGSGNSAKS